MHERRQVVATTTRRALVAGMASYLDAAALVASGLAIGGFYLEPLSLTHNSVGVLLALQTLSFALGALIGGRLGDRIGRRRVLIASLSAYAVGIAVLGTAQGVTALVAGVVLSGLAIGADLPSSLALISEEAPAESKARFIAMSHLLWVAGIASVGILGLLLADLGETAGRLLYLYLFVVAVVVLVLRLELTESQEWTRARSEMPRVGAIHRPMSGADGRVVVALGLYYTAWNLGANTLGQFRPYLWIEVMGGDARGASLLILGGLPIGLAGSALFLRLASSEARHRWVMVGAVTSTLAWLGVTIWPSPETFVLLTVLFVVGASMSGEVAYKIWSQQLVPTLSRSSVQGTTLAIARTVAAGAALVTPWLVAESPRLLFGGLLGGSLLSTAIAWGWIPRLERHHYRGASAPSAMGE